MGLYAESFSTLIGLFFKSIKKKRLLQSITKIYKFSLKKFIMLNIPANGLSSLQLKQSFYSIKTLVDGDIAYHQQSS